MYKSRRSTSNPSSDGILPVILFFSNRSDPTERKGTVGSQRHDGRIYGSTPVKNLLKLPNKPSSVGNVPVNEVFENKSWSAEKGKRELWDANIIANR